MRVVFYDISLITFAKRHVSLNPWFSEMPLRPLEIAGLLISMPTISGQILAEPMFGLDIMIIIRKYEESRGNTNISSSWLFFRPAKSPGYTQAWISDICMIWLSTVKFLPPYSWCQIFSFHKCEVIDGYTSLSFLILHLPEPYRETPSHIFHNSRYDLLPGRLA